MRQGLGASNSSRVSSSSAVIKQRSEFLIDFLPVHWVAYQAVPLGNMAADLIELPRIPASPLADSYTCLTSSFKLLLQGAVAS